MVLVGLPESVRSRSREILETLLAFTQCGFHRQPISHVFADANRPPLRSPDISHGLALSAFEPGYGWQLEFPVIVQAVSDPLGLFAGGNFHLPTRHYGADQSLVIHSENLGVGWQTVFSDNIAVGYNQPLVLIVKRKINREAVYRIDQKPMGVANFLARSNRR